MNSKSFYFLTLILFFNSLPSITAADPLQTLCVQTPFWKLNLCQIDCIKCGANAICQNCQQNFEIIRSQCHVDDKKAINSRFFNGTEIKPSANGINLLNANTFQLSYKDLTMKNIVRLCAVNSYKFDMLGLFNQKARLSYTFEESTLVTQLIIKFYFLTLLPNTSIDLVVNGRQVYTMLIEGQKIASKDDYEPSLDQSSRNYLHIPALKQSSSLLLIKQINSGKIVLDQSEIKSDILLQLQISYKNSAIDSSAFWAVSDFSITGKKCQFCVSQKLKQLSANIGIAIGVTAGLLSVLILILFKCVKYEQEKRRKLFQKNPIIQVHSDGIDPIQQEQNLNIRDTVQMRQRQIPSKNKIN